MKPAPFDNSLEQQDTTPARKESLVEISVAVSVAISLPGPLTVAVNISEPYA